MNIRLEWSDPGSPVFFETEEEADARRPRHRSAQEDHPSALPHCRMSRLKNVEIIWTDEPLPRFRWTEKPADLDLIWPNFTWAKMGAIAVAHRRQWIGPLRQIRELTEQDIEVD